jgi:SAM-dependent methyltransferase
VVRLYQPSSDSKAVTGLKYPSRLLKQVLVGHGIRFGGRVLVAGCGDGELVPFIDGLAYHVDAIDDSSDIIDDVRQKFPQFNFQLTRLDESFPVANDEFDLVVVQDLSVYRNNLLDLRTRTATANLLSCLKPGGDLVFIRKERPSDGGASEHGPECWKRHLACFPGQFESATYGESLFERSNWDWLFGTREHGNFFTVTLQSPPETLHRNFWRDFGRRGLMTGQGLCCQLKTVTEGIRRAA